MESRNRDNPYTPYRTELLSPQRVKELSKLRPIVPVCHTALWWACIVVAWAACSIWTTWWVVLLAIPVIGNRYYAIFLIGHDAFHRRILQDVRKNDRYSDLFLLGPLGAITRLNKKNHLNHHTYLSSTEDPDRHKHSCSSKSDHPSMLGYLTGFTLLGSSIKNVFLGGGESEKKDTESRHTKLDLLILIGWQVLLIGGLSYFVAWWAFPVLWLLPVYIFTYLADSFRSFAEHSQPYVDSEADKHRLISYRAPRLERVLFAPQNMNFHATHHLWPSIPYYNLPIADAEMLESEGVEIRMSYISYLSSYFRQLPLVECQEQ